ncbi:MAG: DUF4437 domain-containing protein [Gemmataceae bacterium]
MRTLSTFLLLSLSLLPAQARADAHARRYLYVVAPGIRDYLEFGGAGILFFDIDDGYRLVKRIATPASAEKKPANIKGVVACPATRRLYFTTPRKLYCVDLVSEKTLWEKALPLGCDRPAITPDGKLLYVPSFEKETWNVVTGDGEHVHTVTTNSGAHNTVCGLDGRRMYLGGLKSNYLLVADTATHKVVSKAGPLGGAVRPFVVNAAQSLAYVCVNGLLGFEVADLTTGKLLHRVEVAGFKQGKVKRHGCPSHGVGLTPDEREAWVCDAANSQMHVFDVTTLPPRQTASIALREQPGWVTFSLDGRWAWPSTGEVIDTRTKKIAHALKDEEGREVHSEKVVEIHFQGGVPVRAGDQFGLGRVTTAVAADHPEGVDMVIPSGIKWQDGPPSLPRGAQMVVLEGDPRKEGPLVMRVKLPDGFKVMPHTHPKDERVTVLAGTLYHGMGAKFDEKACKALPAGSYARTPAGMKHFGYVKGETILQLNGTGPWAIDYVNPADDPRKAK